MHRRRQRGTQGTSPPRNRKNCCRKMVLFPKALFLATTFPKLAKHLIFLLNFYQNFSKFSQNFPTICVFRPNARKSNEWFVKFFWKYAQVMHFKQFLIEIFWKFSKFSQIFRTICVFRPNARKINTWFVKFFWKYAQLMHFKQFLKEIFWKFSKISQIFPTSYVFGPNARKVNTLFV